MIIASLLTPERLPCSRYYLLATLLLGVKYDIVGLIDAATGDNARESPAVGTHDPISRREAKKRFTSRLDIPACRGDSCRMVVTTTMRRRR